MSSPQVKSPAVGGAKHNKFVFNIPAAFEFFVYLKQIQDFIIYIFQINNL